MKEVCEVDSLWNLVTCHLFLRMSYLQFGATSTLIFVIWGEPYPHPPPWPLPLPLPSPLVLPLPSFYQRRQFGATSTLIDVIWGERKGGGKGGIIAVITKNKLKFKL